MKTALITGVSRQKGIGAAIAKELAKNNVRIFCGYWTDYDKQMPWSTENDEPERIRQEIITLGVECEMKQIDLSQPNGSEELFEAVCQRFGCPDILVNNAAYSTRTSFEDITPEEIDKHYFVNFRSAVMICSFFGRRYKAEKKSGRGKIINLTSGQFQGPMPGEIAYVGTKGAIDAMTITLARELAPYNICVNGVNPGPCDSGWMLGGLREELLPRFPFGRIGEPSDAAKLISFLASPEADWITGQIIHSEGGFDRG